GTELHRARPLRGAEVLTRNGHEAADVARRGGNRIDLGAGSWRDDDRSRLVARQHKFVAATTRDGTRSCRHQFTVCLDGQGQDLGAETKIGDHRAARAKTFVETAVDDVTNQGEVAASRRKLRRYQACRDKLAIRLEGEGGS